MINEPENSQSGFTILEVSVASVVSMVGLLCLAGLFTLSISQSRHIKQFSSTTALAQEKLEQLTTLERSDSRLSVGGDLNSAQTVGTLSYSDDICVDDAGEVYTNGNIPSGSKAQYRRFWTVQSSPTLTNTVIVAVRVVALQAGRNIGKSEETTLMSVRSW
jgi:Tfp pilus assembly protein PilV